MAIITTRTREKGLIRIDYEKCNICGLCTNICKDFTLKIENEKLSVSKNSFFGCYGCGQCMAICPTGAITVTGREISPDDLLPLPPKDGRSNYDQLRNLMISRRSIRDFKNMEIEESLINKIVEAAQTAPMGIPPSDVQAVIFNGFIKVNEFAGDVINHIKKMKWMMSKRWSWIWRLPGKETYEQMKHFIGPLSEGLVSNKEKGEDHLFYHAPLAIYFLSSPYSDPADPVIAATYAMLAAESLGLGSCMIGSVDPFLKHGATALRKKWKLPAKPTNGIVVIFGYPKYKFSKTLKRTFAKISILNN